METALQSFDVRHGEYLIERGETIPKERLLQFLFDTAHPEGWGEWAKLFLRRGLISADAMFRHKNFMCWAFSPCPVLRPFPIDEELVKLLVNMGSGFYCVTYNSPRTVLSKIDENEHPELAEWLVSNGAPGGSHWAPRACARIMGRYKSTMNTLCIYTSAVFSHFERNLLREIMTYIWPISVYIA